MGDTEPVSLMQPGAGRHGTYPKSPLIMGVDRPKRTASVQVVAGFAQ